jgi:hypothetical protein
MGLGAIRGLFGSVMVAGVLRECFMNHDRTIAAGTQKLYSTTGKQTAAEVKETSKENGFFHEFNVGNTREYQLVSADSEEVRRSAELGKQIPCIVKYWHPDFKASPIAIRAIIVGDSVGEHSCKALNAFQEALFKTPSVESD